LLIYIFLLFSENYIEPQKLLELLSGKASGHNTNYSLVHEPIPAEPEALANYNVAVIKGL
jgi:hypothetical protein